MKRLTTAGIGIALAASVELTGCGNDAGGGSGDSGKVYVTLVNHVWTENIKSVIPEFEKDTGIKVEYTQMGEDQLSDQYNVKLNAGSSELDVMMYRPLQEGKLFAQNGWMYDLTSYVKQNAEWDWADYQPGPVEATTFEGKVVGVPIITERQALYYRKDLLAASGFTAPPKTMEELEAMAKKISEDNPGIAGFVARTGRAAAVTQFSSFLFSYGGDFDNGSGTATLNTPEAQAAYEMYGGLINKYGPQNVSTDMSWSEAMAIFTQGLAAFYPEADVLYKNATDPEKSKISDVVGFAQFPAGPAGSYTYNIPSWALGINGASKNADNAWKFIEYVTNKTQDLKNFQDGVTSARTSSWENPDATKQFPADLAEASLASAKTGIGHDRPIVIKVPQAREIVGQPIVDGITGKDVAASLVTAQKEYQAFLDSEKK